MAKQKTNFFFRIMLLAMAINTIPFSSQAQSGTIKEKFHWLNISGFVSHSVKYDTRQTVYAREGELLLFPKPIDKDEPGIDRNGFGRLNMFNLHSRMSFGMTGPDFYGFKTSSRLEFDFFGSANDNIATARIRHAFVEIKNTKLGFILGQYWHPTFFTQCFPDVVAWGAAVPTQPFNRSPQIRITYTPVKSLEMVIAALSQRDFANYGPNGRSGDYLRNSGLPEMQFRILAQPNNSFSVGAVAGYKTIVPRLQTDSLLAKKETLSSYNVSGFVKYKHKNLTLKSHAIYGQNLTNLLIIGGYGVKSIDPETDLRNYENFHSLAFWGEAEYEFNDFMFAFFAGYVAAPDNKTKHYYNYGLGTNIESLVRWSPRVVYKKDKLKFGIEISATTAKYLDQTIEKRFIVGHTASNYRYIFSTAFVF